MFRGWSTTEGPPTPGSVSSYTWRGSRSTASRCCHGLPEPQIQPRSVGSLRSSHPLRRLRIRAGRLPYFLRSAPGCGERVGRHWLFPSLPWAGVLLPKAAIPVGRESGEEGRIAHQADVHRISPLVDLIDVPSDRCATRGDRSFVCRSMDRDHTSAHQVVIEGLPAVRLSRVIPSLFRPTLPYSTSFRIEAIWPA